MTNSWPPNCKLDAADTERRRLIDRYPGGFIELTELQHRATEISARRKELQHKRTSLADERTTLARQNQLRRRVHDFAATSTPLSTPSTTPKNNSCCACSSKTSGSPAGMFRSGCASHSTHHQTRPVHASRRPSPAGVHVKAVAELLGHSSVNVTGDVYGHTSDGTAQAAVDGSTGVPGL
jgi:hypothetical protein